MTAIWYAPRIYIQSATSALAPASHNADINNFCVRTAITAHTSIPITIKICHTAIPPYRQEIIPILKISIGRNASEFSG
jgi:hypothetical protein